MQAAALPASALYGEQAGALGEAAAAAAAAAAGEAEPGTFAQPPADPMQQDETAMAAGAAQDLPGLPSFSSPALQQPEQQRPQEQGPPLQLPQPLQDSATAAGGLGAASAAASGSLGSNPPLGLRSPAARSPSSGAAAGSDGRRSPGGYSESQLRQAQQLASRMRAECDMLK